MTRLLLLEANDDTRWVGSRVGPKVHVMPVALLGLAAYARSIKPETQVQVAETSLVAPDDERLGRIIAEFAPDFIGIRSISLFVEEVRRVVAASRRGAKAPVILGGPIATALKERVFDEVPDLEFAAVQEGEPVIAALLRGDPLPRIPGVYARTARGIVGNPPAPAPRELDLLPPADLQLIDIELYARQLSYAYNQRRQGVLVTSRGCPYSCTYCFQISEAPVRLQTAQRVVADIRRLVEDHGVHDFYVVDDVFNLNRKRALAVFEMLTTAALPARLYFVNGLRVDLCDEAFVDAMVRAGTVWVTYAIESAHPRIQAMIRKKLDLEHARRIINYSQRKGIVVNVNTMFGFPTETAEEAQVTLDYLATLDHPSLLPYHFNLRGYPGCEIVDQAERAGWNRNAFLATGFSSYGDLPAGSPSFSRHAMMDHMLRFHERFGLANRDHLRFSVDTLRRIGYSDRELCDMYTVLLNRTIQRLPELFGERPDQSNLRWA
jgi:anaerobic magnesium-protoporphyrin IX monomethyl ester cyclase